MSRLVIKNLPKSVTQDKLRNIFQEKGTVTDVQLKFTSEGKFRQFAFIGYKTETEANEAIKYFNNIFIDTKKITVEPCASLGEATKTKARAKHLHNDSDFKKPNLIVGTENTKQLKENKTEDESKVLLKKYQNDTDFQEFLELHDPEKSKALRNLKESSTKSEDSITDEEAEEKSEEETKVANESISDLDYMKKLVKSKKEKKEPKNITLFTIKLKGLPYNCKKKVIKDFFKPVKPFSIRRPTKIHGIAYVGFKTEKLYNKALQKDRSFIDGKRISVAKYCSETNTSESTPSNTRNKWVTQEEALKNEEDISESGNIFIRNLAYSTTEDDLETLFQKFGPLAEVNLPIDSITKKIKGFGTITFVMPEHAVKAYNELDGSILHGRMLHLLPGKTKDTHSNEINEDDTNFKKKKQAKQKSQAKSSHNWNSLFLGHDAVAEVIADTYNTTKEKVLGPHDKGSAAVRLALGETQIVAQTRKYLENEGVVLDVFNGEISKRSKTIIIVKNLPHKTEPMELRQLFQKFGLLGRIILPPSGITGLVEFLEPTEARKAFTTLAYSKFKNVPLYLEWAPENSLIEGKNVEVTKTQVIEDTKISKGQVEENKSDDIVEEPEPDSTIFVKNLNFQTTEDSLKEHFKSCGKIAYATIAAKKDKADPSKKLSMGYGFVRFMYKSDADKALKDLQQSDLDGKSLELKRSERTLSNDINVSRKPQKASKQTGTKILVRNIPFQATGKEIRELFCVFGEIKALRLPKKMSLDGGTHRGFAFVDYVTTSDAKNAFEALSQSTHLYGRRLVLEWASAEDNVEDIRKRTATHLPTINTQKTKKSKIFNVD